ncbi:MAG TPA: DUF6785 family protein [Abditibacterium sp.]|jgi:hypothetical protein
MPTITTPREEVVVTENAPRESGVTFRVVCLCLALAVFFGYIIPIIDVKLSNTFLGAQHLPPGAVATLMVLLLVVQPLLRLLSKRFRLSRNELLTVYISCLFSCLVPGHGAETFFVPNLVGVFYYASPENKWLEIWSQLKPWLTPTLSQGKYDETVAEGWYLGLEPGATIPWGAWLVPIAAWCSLILAIYIMFACLSVMLRKQWGDYEALTFPLLRLPLEMTEEEGNTQNRAAVGRFFRNPVMWIGFGIAVFIQMTNGLALYYPDIPVIPMQLTGNFFSEPPWNQMETIPLQIYPITVGITYLLTAEVSFSLWFFYWFIKFQYLTAYYLGFMPATMPNAMGSVGKIFTGYQHVGAYFAYVAMILWAGRQHFKHIARRAFGRAKSHPDEAKEPLSYPVSFWGFWLAFAFIVTWTWAAGVSWSLALTLWGIYLVIAIGLSRVIAEGGLLILEHGWQPLGTIAQFFGSGTGHWISQANGLVPASLLQGIFMVDVRGFLMPSFVQSFKLAHDRKIHARRLLALIAAVTLVSFAMGVWMTVGLGYTGGGGLTFHSFTTQIGPRIPAWGADSLLRGVDNASPWHAIWLGIGALITYGLIMARSYYPGLPLHPLGYLVCLTNVIPGQWLSIFIGWMLKTTITRFMGNESYRKMIPAFLGLALGDVAMIVFWLIVDGFTGRTGHSLGM